MNDGTTTSSPGPTPIARSAIVIASVPLATPTACAAPQYAANSRSNARHLRAQDVALGVEHPLDRRAQLHAQGDQRRRGVEQRHAHGVQRARQQLEVRARHQPDQLLEARLRLPAQVALGLRCVADQVVDLGRAHERRVDRDVALEVAQPGLVEGDLAALAHRVGLPGRDHVVLGDVALEHQPHRFHVVLCIAPVAFRVEVAQAQLLRQPVLDRRRVPGDLAGDELQAPAGGVVHDQPTHPGAEDAALGLDVEHPFIVGHGRAAPRGAPRSGCAAGAGPWRPPSPATGGSAGSRSVRRAARHTPRRAVVG